MDRAATAQDGEKIERILCCNVLDTETTHRSSIYRHSLYEFEEALPWPPAQYESICCWHCCHPPPAEAKPICIPNSYDRKKDVYHVFGFFCSLSCAKSYLVEHAALAAGEKLLLLQFLAVKHFGYGGELTAPAPPRHRLKMFGGDLSIEAFRGEHVFLTKTLSPPLISTPEVYERLRASADVLEEASAGIHSSSGGGQGASSCSRLLGSNKRWSSQVSGTDAPESGGAATSLFSSFVRQKRAAGSSGVSFDKFSDQSIPGTLSIFMKRPR